ncbi:Uncharacterised protein [Bordetella pertussis]|nr:Uncharacterised protein [Bordetella pertussis]
MPRHAARLTTTSSPARRSWPRVPGTQCMFQRTSTLAPATGLNMG